MAILSPRALHFAASRKNLIAALAAAALVSGAGAARAQFFDRPAADVPKQDADAPSQDTSALLRIDRLESQVRDLNGQVEQLQFQVRRLEDALRKFQSDADSRLDQPADHAAPRHRSDLNDDENAGTAVAANVPPPAEPNAPAAAAAPALPPPVATAGPGGRRHDAFDPAAQPSAPGAPLPLGSPGSASKPLDIRPPSLRSGDAVASAETPPGPSAENPAAQAAALPPADPVRAEYETAVNELKSQHYDAAQQAFAAFVQKNSRSRYVAPATFHLGEAYFYQNRHREAAEQFLKIAKDYAASPVAPYAMVRLGISLNALGAKEQACAFFSEMPRKYPNAAAAEKLAAEREAKKASC
jgi:tol-pal system protein YbgF